MSIVQPTTAAIETHETMPSVGHQSMISRPNRQSPWLPVAITLVSGIAASLLVFPGEMTADSADQLVDARGGHNSDWHSPLLTHLWRLMLRLHDASWTMLVLQSLLYWAGAALLVAGFVKIGLRRRALAVLAIALFPHFLFFNHYILKDTAHYSAMFLAAAACFWIALDVCRSSRILWLSVASLLAFCALIRVNSAFAVAPLLVGLVFAGSVQHYWRYLTLSLLVSALLVIMVREMNSAILKAEPSDPEQSLQIFDMLGVQYYSRDPNIWGVDIVSNDEVDQCYTAYYWDTMSPNGVCRWLRPRIGAVENGVFSSDGIRLRGSLWLRAVREHPWAYLNHRLHHFNSAIFFAVPALHARFNMRVRDGSSSTRLPLTERDVRFDYLKKNFMVWPVTWLATGLGALVMLYPSRQTSSATRYAVILLTSGLLYGFAYLVVGVATDVRYFLWTTLAVMLAVVVGWEELRQSWLCHRRRRGVVLTAVVGILCVGMTCRLLGTAFK